MLGFFFRTNSLQYNEVTQTPEISLEMALKTTTVNCIVSGVSRDLCVDLSRSLSLPLPFPLSLSSAGAAMLTSRIERGSFKRTQTANTRRCVSLTMAVRSSLFIVFFFFLAPVPSMHEATCPAAQLAPSR